MDWQILRAAHVCARDGRTIEPGETFRTYLFEAGEGYARQDFCAGCRPENEAAAVGSWQSRRPASGVKAITLDREAIYGFFQRLSDATEPAKVQFRFVLGLFLWRKKVMKFETTEVTDGGEAWHFSTKTGDRHRLLRPDLDEERIEYLSRQLDLLLGGHPSELTAVVQEAQVDDAEAREPEPVHE